ncbi:AB-hydrolase YheT [Clavulina sp. PMI_390]|nr:AB-hydrolase YheT [Clavulina sp. PMI_390]
MAPALVHIGPILIFPFLLLLGWLTRTIPTSIYYPRTPLKFKVKRNDPSDPKGAKKTELMGIRDFLESRVPSLYKPFEPTWWLLNGHMQTGYVVAADFTKVDEIVYERTLLRLPDGGTIGLDFTPTKEEAPDMADDTPIVVVQHGLTGGSYESYVRSVLAGACKPKSEGGLGFRGVVVNFRGCANVPVTSPQFYSAAPTDDLRCGTLYLSHKYPNAPLIGLGFSLGANILTRYLGEEGARSRLIAGVALACPWNVEKNMLKLNNEFFVKHIYAKALGANLVELFKSHLDTVRSFPPDDRLTPIIEPVLALKNPTFGEVDAVLTIAVGGPRPLFPMPSALAYWKHSCSHKHPIKIRVPFLAINTEDDPIVAYNPVHEVQDAQTTALAVTPYGGHLGWFTGGKFFTGIPIPFSGGRTRGPPPDRWVRQPVLEFLKAAAEDLVPAPTPGSRSREDRFEKDGFILEKGKEKVVGFKVVSEGKIISGEQDESAKNLIAGL